MQRLPGFNGAFDNACGLYSIVNSIGNLVNLTNVSRKKLFDETVQGLPENVSKKLLSGGIDASDFLIVLNCAIQVSKTLTDKTVEFKTMTETPQHKVTIYKKIKALFKVDHLKCEVVLGIEYKTEGGHWTYVTNVSPSNKKVFLHSFDSAGNEIEFKKKYYGDSWCHKICTDEIFIIYYRV
jgi:hypothetical protein